VKLAPIRHLWGLEHVPLADLLPRLRAAGDAGLANLLEAHELRALPFVPTEGDDVDAHVTSFASQLARAEQLGATQVTAHSGRDHWSEDDAVRFFDAVTAIEANRAVIVAHETHRGRVLNTPWRTAAVLRRVEPLRLCCDFSHWVVVAERLLDPVLDELDLAAARCAHLHARVGYAQGPQVPDPRAPEYADEVVAHEAWWLAVWRAQRDRGLAESTVVCEYGPPRYLHTLPFSDVPVVDLEAVCEWQARRVRELFAEFESTVAA
jgi:hypothetical protein